MYYFKNGKDRVMVGITGTLNYVPHCFTFGYKYLLMLEIFIHKDSYYCLGFGNKIPNKRFKICKSKHPSCIKHKFEIYINSNKLYNILK